jgi:hypothetical protein
MYFDFGGSTSNLGDSSARSSEKRGSKSQMTEYFGREVMQMNKNKQTKRINITRENTD